MGESLSTSQKTTNNTVHSNIRASPLLPSPHIPDVVSSARSEPQQHSVVNMIKEEFKNPIRPPRRKKSSVPTTPVEVNFTFKVPVATTVFLVSLPPVGVFLGRTAIKSKVI
jgi:hypothetical protein